MGLVTDSLRYWVTDMHVDGFRFDLAPVLVRGDTAEQPSAFFEILQQDPILSQGQADRRALGRQSRRIPAGPFPPGWSEWNGAYRDCVRKFWRGDPGQVPELASRLTGSSDIFAPTGRQTYASVNFVCLPRRLHPHTTSSRTSDKHNDANGEDRPTAPNDNLSRNWGAEGPTRVGANPAHPRANEAQLLRHPVLLPGRADAARRRRDGADPARQQQRLLPRQRHQLVRLGRSTRSTTKLRAFVRELIEIARTNPDPAPTGLLHGPARRGLRDERRSWVRADGRR